MLLWETCSSTEICFDMNINWEQAVINGPAEFPVDLLSPSNKTISAYYWNEFKNEMVESYDSPIIVIPVFDMTDDDVVLAKQAMLSFFKTTRRLQCVEIISGDQRGLAIFMLSTGRLQS